MPAKQHVYLGREGHHQTLRIPKEFELASDEAMLHKEGERLVIEPVEKPSLLALLATLEPISETFPDVDENVLPLDDIAL